MFPIILSACALVAVTVAVHAGGLAALLRALLRSQAPPPARFWPLTWLLIRVTWVLILIHVTEIAVWALFYLWAGCLPDAESAFYFSGVTYATIGYGDLVLPQSWRMLGPVEGLTGILMCGLSTGFFFALLSRVFGAKFKAEPH
ncbi:MAG: two pore domain potassium channel family protein [Azonexaceae bacterium]|nr:two pore domain potassium channel family protein [Azonexaceae bacterium]